MRERKSCFDLSDLIKREARRQETSLSRYDGILFSLACGTVESGKKVVLTAEESDDESMTSAAEIGSAEIVGDGSTAKNSACLYIAAEAVRKRYVRVKVSNTSASADVLLSVVGAAESARYPKPECISALEELLR